MPNLNETECDCQGIYDASIGGCDPTTPEIACPNGSGGGSGWLATASGWNWNVIGENALTWGYALGLLKPPNTQQDNSLYLMQLECKFVILQFIHVQTSTKCAICHVVHI